MAEVEDLPQAPVPLVLLDHLPLEVDAAGDDFPEAVPGCARFEQGEEGFVEDRAVFDHLRHPVGEGLGGQEGEHVGVAGDKGGLPEGADEVFALGDVDARLAADPRSRPIASRVVGTCTKETPRSQVAATKPARSPTTPPPTARMRSVRVMLLAERKP